MKLIGVISDTHGLLRDEAMIALDGSDLLLHAGDIGPSSILRCQEDIAPVIAVRGNVDTDAWARSLAEKEKVLVGRRTIRMIHNRADFQPDCDILDIDVVISVIRTVPR
jgi:putative phosphoesterase